MNRTKIEWALNPDGTQGYTWNPITGCLNGCEYCYARKLANTRLRERYLANVFLPELWDKELTFDRGAREREYDKHRLDPFYPRFWEDRIGEPDKWGFDSKPHGVFVCDMADLFGIGVPEEWTRRVLGVIDEQLMRPEKDRFYLLTKQPQNLAKFSPFPDNCWVGASATDTKMALEACLHLGDITASVRYLSLEPMLHSINLPFTLLETCHIGQVIIGAQTKPNKKPNINWVLEVAEACDNAKIPVFMKNNLLGKPPKLFEDGHFAVRQEIPQINMPKIST